MHMAEVAALGGRVLGLNKEGLWLHNGRGWVRLLPIDHQAIHGWSSIKYTEHELYWERQVQFRQVLEETQYRVQEVHRMLRTGSGE